MSVTFDKLLAAAKESSDIKEMGVLLGIAPYRIYGLFCVTGKNIKGLSELDETSKIVMQKQFSNNNLFNYLLNKGDLKFLNKKKLEILLNFNISTVAALFSSTPNTIRRALEKKGLGPKPLDKKKDLTAESYVDAQEFIKYVNGLRKEHLNQFLLQLAMLDLKNAHALTQWITSITNFLKPYLEGITPEGLEHNQELIRTSLPTYNDYLYGLLWKLSTRQNDIYLTHLCKLYKSQEVMVETNLSNEVGFVGEDESNPQFFDFQTSQSPPDLFSETLNTLEEKLEFLLRCLNNIDLSVPHSLMFWFDDMSNYLQPVLARNSTMVDVVMDISRIIDKSVHTPNADTQKILSELVNNNVDNFYLGVLSKGYEHYFSTKKRKYESFDNELFNASSQPQNYLIDLPQPSQHDEALLSIEQFDDLEETIQRPHKARRSNSFFPAPTGSNFLQSKLEELAIEFSAINFTNSNELFENWLKDLDSLFLAFEFMEEKLDIATLAQALPNSFENPELRSKLRLLASCVVSTNVNLLVDAMESRYPDSNDLFPL